MVDLVAVSCIGFRTQQLSGIGYQLKCKTIRLSELWYRL